MSQEHIFTTEVAGTTVTFTTGKLAQQAGGAVTIQVGESMLLATATMSKSAREGLDFFPLSVEYEEKMYAAGRIPGSFFRREGRPSTEATLICRLVDRPLRPLFPDGMRNEVQIIVTTLSSDSVHHLDIMAVNAASAAIMLSDIPWEGPIGAVRVGYIDGQFVANPEIAEMEHSQLDLRMAGTRDAIIMVEAGANEIPEEVLVQALAFGHSSLQGLIDVQLQMREAIGKGKRDIRYNIMDEAMVTAMQARLGDRLELLVAEQTDRHERSTAVDELREEIINEMVSDDESALPKDLLEAFG